MADAIGFETILVDRPAPYVARITLNRVEKRNAINTPMRAELLRVRSVAKVELFGEQDEKVFIELSNSKLVTLGLDLNTIVQLLAAQNAVVPAGSVWRMSPSFLRTWYQLPATAPAGAASLIQKNTTDSPGLEKLTSRSR